MGRQNKKIFENVMITGIADKGRAVGRTAEGQVIFTEGPVPGDIVDILALRKRKGFLEGVVKTYHKLSDERTDPLCPHFGVCGGCKWQHLSYQSQLNYKFQVVKDNMTRIARLPESVVAPVLPCNDVFFYRNKLEYSFSDKRWITEEEVSSGEEIQQSPALGFHRPGFFEKIVDIKTCKLQDSRSDDIRNFIRAFTLDNGYSFYDVKQHKGLMRNMIIRNTTLGEWMVVVVFGQNDDKRISAVMKALRDQFPFINSLQYVVNTKWNDTIFDLDIQLYHGQSYITENLGNVSYRIGPKSFFQTNSKQAVALFDVAVSFAELRPEDIVYDLYTGLGSIALYIASRIQKVIGIEEIEPAIADARLNMELNNISNALFYSGDVKDLLNRDFMLEHGRPDVVITDPPRAGMHEKVIQTLLQMEAPKIIYVSCNPATQARDLALLSEKYEVLAVQPVDMFPHTHHVESVANLRLK
jgi:23S rRNA (uracil1939-C5)-methyltransferase